MTDIILTWPKSKPLDRYLTNLRAAYAQDQTVLFKVASRPDVDPDDKAYMVHEGAIRGWMRVIGVVESSTDHSATVRDPETGELMNGKIWIVREPVWHGLGEAIPMAGFRGFRYVDRLPDPERQRLIDNA